MTSVAGDWVWEDCHKCRVRFAMPLSLYRTLQERKEAMSFWCPNGHPQVYLSGENEATKLRRERDLLKQQLARLEDEKREAELAEEKARKEAARLKRRVAGGVCPCCTRTFANVQRHMKSKHPEMAARGENVVRLLKA